MPTVSTDTFNNLNLMAGTVRSFQQAPIPPTDQAIWDRDWNLLINDLKNLVDPQLGADLQANYTFYLSALQVAEGYFSKPFGGLKSASGQFGFRILGPQDFKQAASAVTPAYYSWKQTITTVAAHTYGTYVYGYSSGPVYTSSVMNQREIAAFHRLINYSPAPKIEGFAWTVNSFPYTPYTMEPFSKIARGSERLYKLFNMPGNIILHPGGNLSLNVYFDLETGATAPSGTTNYDIELAPLGLVFAEFDYLNTGVTTFV